MFGIFTSRPKDYLIATNETNVNSLVNNIYTSENFYQLILRESEINSLTNYGLTNELIKQYIEPVIYSSGSKFCELYFHISLETAIIDTFVGLAKKLDLQ